MPPCRIWHDIYLIGGSDVSHPLDCCIYLIDAGELVLIDTGMGYSFPILIGNIRSLGFDPKDLSLVIATHRHIDHVGSLAMFRQKYNIKVVAHRLDADAMESGKGVGASFYGVTYHPCPVDIQLEGKESELKLTKHALRLLHIPGHTPGSIAVYLDCYGKRVLFGQDIHGPYEPMFGGNIEQAIISLKELLELKADLLCEGHYGVLEPKAEVIQYINGHLRSLEKRLPK